MPNPNCKQIATVNEMYRKKNLIETQDLGFTHKLEIQFAKFHTTENRGNFSQRPKKNPEGKTYWRELFLLIFLAKH